MSKSVPQKHAGLVERLYEQTIRKALDWQLTSERDPQVNLGEWKIRLWWNNNDGSPIEYVSIYDKYEEFIESFSDEDLFDEKITIQGFDQFWIIMGETRKTAFRQAVGADKAVDDILSLLNNQF